MSGKGISSIEQDGDHISLYRQITTDYGPGTTAGNKYIVYIIQVTAGVYIYSKNIDFNSGYKREDYLKNHLL